MSAMGSSFLQGATMNYRLIPVCPAGFDLLYWIDLLDEASVSSALGSIHFLSVPLVRS